MVGGSSSGLGGRAGRDGAGSTDAARRRRQAASRGLFDFSSEAHSGGDPPWPSLGIGGVGRTSGEEVSGASQARHIAPTAFETSLCPYVWWLACMPSTAVEESMKVMATRGQRLPYRTAHAMALLRGTRVHDVDITHDHKVFSMCG